MVPLAIVVTSSFFPHRTTIVSRIEKICSHVFVIYSDFMEHIYANIQKNAVDPADTVPFCKYSFFAL
jgi:hypothetical protein